MANFTQLHLSNHTAQDPAKKNQGGKAKSSLSKEKTLFGAGLLALTLTSGIFLLITNGCSKGSSRVSVSPEPRIPTNQSAMNSAPLAPLAQPAAVAPKPAKKRVQRKAPMSTYSDPTYGVSFRYPKNYILKTGDEPHLDLDGSGPVQTNFVEPGALTLAAIELPKSSYPGTDFTAGFFSVSVNSALSQAKCEAFAFPKNTPSENGEPAEPAKVKVGGNEFMMVEDIGDAENKQPHMKYFHHFENGNCYEFGVGLGTVDDSVAGLKPVNRSLVFGKLEQILATVKVKPGVVPEVAKEGQGHPMVEGSKE